MFPGEGSLDVEPENGSGLLVENVQVTIPDQVGNPADTNVQLDEEVLESYAGHVRDRAASGVENAVVVYGSASRHRRPRATDDMGAFELSVTLSSTSNASTAAAAT